MMPDLPNVGLERDIEQFIVSTYNCILHVCMHIRAEMNILIFVRFK